MSRRAPATARDAQLTTRAPRRAPLREPRLHPAAVEC